jgi:hypothetical protein
MARPRPRGTVVHVDARQPEHTVLEQARTLFLVEFRGSSPASGGVDDMHAALRHAVSRVAASGIAIRWCGGWLLPADERCLCLIEASDEACVVLARDTAALTAARVHPVRSLDGPAATSPSLRTRGRS